MSCWRAIHTAVWLSTATDHSAWRSVDFVSVKLAQKHLLCGVKYRVGTANRLKDGILLMSCWHYVCEAHETWPSSFINSDGWIKVTKFVSINRENVRQNFDPVMIMNFHFIIKIRHSTNTTFRRVMSLRKNNRYPLSWAYYMIVLSPPISRALSSLQ